MPVSPDQQKYLGHLIPSTQPSSSTSPNNNMKEQWTTNNQLLLEDQCDQHGTAECVRYYRPACVYAVNLPLFQAAVPEAADAPHQQQARQSCHHNFLTNHDTLSNAKATTRKLALPIKPIKSL